MTLVGTETQRYDGNNLEEHTVWVGKPWRRLEYLRRRCFWKGECVDTQRTWGISLGSVRLGWHFNLQITRAVGADYSDEPNQ